MALVISANTFALIVAALVGILTALTAALVPSGPLPPKKIITAPVGEVGELHRDLGRSGPSAAPSLGGAWRDLRAPQAQKRGTIDVGIAAHASLVPFAP